MTYTTGGGMHGCMGAVNKGARSLNGKILGVIHEKWCVDGEEDPMIPDMIVVGEHGPITWTNRQSVFQMIITAVYRNFLFTP